MKSNARPLVLGALLWLGIATAATARSAADVQLAQQRFESTAKAQRKLLERHNAKLNNVSTSPEQKGKTDQPDTPAKDVLDNMRFVFERSALPDVRNERRFGEIRVVVTDGWMALAEDMIRASAVRESQCLKEYERTALLTAHGNRTQAAEHKKPDLKAIPRLPDFVVSQQERDSKRNACKGVNASQLFKPSIEQKVVAGMDAMLVWLIARQAALHLEAAQASPASAVKASGENNSFCSDLVADRHAEAYARAMRVDLQPAQAAMVAHAMLFTAESERREDCASQRLYTLLPDKEEAKSRAEFIKALGLKSTN